MGEFRMYNGTHQVGEIPLYVVITVNAKLDK